MPDEWFSSADRPKRGFGGFFELKTRFILQIAFLIRPIPVGLKVVCWAEGKR
jgi:hypothetical protein